MAIYVATGGGHLAHRKALSRIRVAEVRMGQGFRTWKCRVDEKRCCGKGFSQFSATQLTKGDHPAVAYGWYKWFLTWVGNGQYHWMAKVVAVGELVIGIMLIVGIFTGIAALFGATLNFSYVFAGSAG